MNNFIILSSFHKDFILLTNKLETESTKHPFCSFNLLGASQFRCPAYRCKLEGEEDLPYLLLWSLLHVIVIHDNHKGDSFHCNLLSPSTIALRNSPL